MLSNRGSKRAWNIRVAALGVALPWAILPPGAYAGDLTVSTSTTTPVVTSNADGAGAGDVEVTSAGSIRVITNETAITIDSDNSVINSGTITANELNGAGIAVTADTTGGIVNEGTITTGTAETANDDVVEGGPAVAVNEDLGLGISNSGTIRTYGSNTILIDASAGNITVGPSADGASLYNDGDILAFAYNSSTGGATALSIFGGGAFSATLTDGIINDEGGVIGAASNDQDATAISIGDGGVVSSLSNLGLINARTFDDEGIGGEAVAIEIELGGSLASIDNEGTIYATAGADGTDATAIRDLSGTLTSIVNSGSIYATATDTGTATAIDLSGSTTGATIDNSGSITGDILFGAGAHALNSTDGTIESALSVNGGDLTVSLSGGAVAEMSSTLTGGGTLALNVDDAVFYVAEGEVFEATTANFGADSTFYTTYDPSAGAGSGYLSTTGATTFDAGATVDVQFSSYLATSASLLIVEATTVNGIGDLVIGGVSAGYDAQLNQIGNELYLDLVRKTAAQLGYTGNLATIYNAAPGALVLDDELGSEMGGIGTEAELQAAYEQLLPDLTGSRERSAVLTQEIAGEAISSRLEVMRASPHTARALGRQRAYSAGWWAKQSISTLKRDGDNVTGYDADVFAFSLGYDRFDGEGGGGIVFTYTGGTYNHGRSGADDSDIASYALHLYKSLHFGRAYWDVNGGVALNDYDLKRHILIGSVDYNAESSSFGYQGMIGTNTGYRADLGGLVLSPSIGLDYTYLSMDAYEESGANGANLNVDSSDFQSLRARAGLRVAFPMGTRNALEPYVEGGYSAELIADDAVVDGRFSAGGGAFSLTGEQANESVAFGKTGVVYSLGGGSLAAGYSGKFGSDFSSHQVALTASLQF